MGAQLRVYRRRIRTVQSTKKITSAMELIAASRIAKAQARIEASRPYSRELTRALKALAANASLSHPMLTGTDSPARTGVLIVTSDRGLAGGYNVNVLRRANDLVASLQSEGREVERYVIGRKGRAYYRFRNVPLAGVWTGFSEQPRFDDAHDATNRVVHGLVATSGGQVHDHDGTEIGPGIDELYVVHTRFVNSVTQAPVAEQVAPVKHATHDDDADDPLTDSPGEGPQPSYEFEPEPEQLIETLLPRYITARIYSALLESAASESAARRRAMKSASDNASDLIRTYTRLANQARQAEITQEISEIVGGADALAKAGDDE